MRKKLFFVLCAIVNFLLGVFCFVYNSSNFYFYNYKSIFEKYFTLWDHGTEGLFLILTMVLCAIAIVLDKYKEYYYQFHQVCMIRMSFKKYLFLNIKQIFLHTIFYMIVLHGLLLIFDCLYFQSPLVAEYGDYCYFVDNQTINILIFIVLSCLGTALFNIFLYSLSIYINNIYVFIVSPIIVLFVSFIIASSVSSLFGNIIDSIIDIELIGQSFAVGLMTSTLIEPGISAYYPFVGVVTAFIIYGVLSIFNYIYTGNKLEIG